MTYEQALEWVHGLKRLGAAPGLARMQKLMAALGNPQQRLRFVHVAGTNGKGSVTTMVAAIAAHAGYRVGANISPYVMDFTERFQINAVNIAPQRLAQVLDKVRTAAEKLAEAPIEFEAVTAAALLYFAEEACDLVCLEAGIGGRLDASNIIENTLVACITKVGLDHTEILGPCLADIAAEKCGIIKPGCVVVCDAEQPPEAAEVIARMAAEKQCKLVVPKLDALERVRKTPLYINSIIYRGQPVEVPFMGRHQALNAAMALEAAAVLAQKGYAISPAQMAEGVAAARIPARIEVLQREPLVLLDGAHNVDSAKALAGVLEEAGLRHWTAVAGMLDGKDVQGVMRLLARYVDVLYTVTPDSPRAVPAEGLAQQVKGLFGRVQACENVAEALGRALLAEDKKVLIFGSFYLAQTAKKYFSDNS
ncbi:MAG: folylpolyglutamate synthase/dihydrofolate synthase family protein [Oscillospiraceae bacterium]